LANGTSASDTDASVSPKKAAALSKEIQKGTLGKNVSEEIVSYKCSISDHSILKLIIVD